MSFTFSNICSCLVLSQQLHQKEIGIRGRSHWCFLRWRLKILMDSKIPWILSTTFQSEHAQPVFIFCSFSYKRFNQMAFIFPRLEHPAAVAWNSLVWSDRPMSRSNIAKKKNSVRKTGIGCRMKHVYPYHVFFSERSQILSTGSCWLVMISNLIGFCSSQVCMYINPILSIWSRWSRCRMKFSSWHMQPSSMTCNEHEDFWYTVEWTIWIIKTNYFIIICCNLIVYWKPTGYA